MGKGGGCIPSKKKSPITDQEENEQQQQQPLSVEIETQIPKKDDTTATSRSIDVVVLPTSTSEAVKKLKLYIVFYSMYGHVESLARSLKKGVDSVDGVEGVLYRVLETLPKEVLELMKAPEKGDDDEVPIISAENLVEADGLLFGFPTRYGSMAGQMKAFFDSTGQLWREQKLAGVPAGFFVSTGTQGGGQETTA